MKRLLVALLLVAPILLPVHLETAFAQPVAPADERPAVPPGARVSLETEKTSWFLGENIIVHFKVENMSNVPFTIWEGGDYRGGTRANRFKVVARDTNGQQVLDPAPLQANMGGIGGSQTLHRGEAWFGTISLLPYCRFDQPGDYKIEVTHDLGWHATPARPLPSATLLLHIAMPSAIEARAIVNALEKMPANNGVLVGEKNTRPMPDFSALRFTVYLPILTAKLRAGDARFLPSVAGLDTPDSTRLLVELLHAPAPLSLQAAQALSERLPVDAASSLAVFDQKPTKEEQAAITLRQERIASSWREEFRAPILAYAYRGLESADRDTLRLGASLVDSLGHGVDLAEVLTALDKRLEQTALHPRWQFTGQEAAQKTDVTAAWQLQDDCLELIHTAQSLVLRGARLPEGERPAVLAVRTEAVRRHTATEKLANAKEAVRLLRHPLPFIRQLALESQMPAYSPNYKPESTTLAPELLAQLPTMLKDPDVSVRSAACELIAFTRPDPSLRAPLLQTLRHARNDWDAGSANHAAQNLGVSFEAEQIWASRLNEPRMFGVALSSLIGLLSANGFSSRTDTPPQGAAFQARWEKFLLDNEALLRAGKKLTSKDVPRDLLPDQWSL